MPQWMCRKCGGRIRGATKPPLANRPCPACDGTLVGSEGYLDPTYTPPPVVPVPVLPKPKRTRKVKLKRSRCAPLGERMPIGRTRVQKKGRQR